MHEAERIRVIIAALRVIRPGRAAAGERANVSRALALAKTVSAEALETCASIADDVALDTEVAIAEADLVHLICNLLENAGLASGNRPNHITITASTGPEDEVRLVVADTGVGMDEATRARAFEPFFTTREVGKGRGVGLSVCRGIALTAGGDIGLESERGLGTRVTVILPIAPASS